MAIVTLNGIEYISESVGDESIPAHNYDDIIDVSKAEDPDQWINRVQAEWPNLPNEIKNKVIDSTSKHIGDLTQNATGTTPTTPATQPAPLVAKPPENTPVVEGSTGTYDFKNGRDNMAKSSDIELSERRLQLIELIRDQQALELQGEHVPELEHYWDEYIILNDEISRRLRRGKAVNTKLEPVMVEEAVDGAGNEIFDFAEGRKRAASASKESLEYVIGDLRKVISIQEKSHRDGHNTPKLGYYWDEYWTLIDEVARRMKKGETFNLPEWDIDGQPVDDKMAELGN